MKLFIFANPWGSRVDSIDIQDFLKVGEEQRKEINFVVGSVCELPFEDDTFDAVFYYHVIEHVDQPAESLEEIHRVTRGDGWVFVGTPNRSRIMSSIGAHTPSEWNPTFMNKFYDNARDWKDRLTGRFHNHFGAHAGFTTGELDGMTRRLFPKVEWVHATVHSGKVSEQPTFWINQVSNPKTTPLFHRSIHLCLV